jgi:N-glycosylase/DNA lyase
VFESFYLHERLPKQKVNRLDIFLHSSLAKQLWNQSSDETSSRFSEIWQSLALVMDQKPEDKTISFAMKCLGISLLMVQNYDFDYSDISIPVDSRVYHFTKKIGLCATQNNDEIRRIWHDVLILLQKGIPHLTMIHLDSLIWQIASLQGEDWEQYFFSLNIRETGKDLRELIYLDSTISTNEISDKTSLANSVVHSRLSSDKRILFLFPCSGKKSGDYVRHSFILEEQKSVLDDLKTTRSILQQGRADLSSVVNFTTAKIPALDRYDGNLYRCSPDFRQQIKDALSDSRVTILILSGGYGIVYPSEGIHYYEKKMDAPYWISHDLPSVLEEFIRIHQITHVYGFFSVSTDYMTIMKTIDWESLKKTSPLKSVKTYYINFQGHGGAQVIVPKLTGLLIERFIASHYSEDTFYSNPFFGHEVRIIDHIQDPF